MRSKILTKLFFVFLLLLSIVGVSRGQAGSVQPNATKTNMTSKWYNYLGYVGVDSGFFIPSRDTMFTPINGSAAITRRTQDQGYYGYDSAAAAWGLINGNFFVKIQTQNPTASLDSGSNYEYHPAGTFVSTLSYSGGRLASGTNLAATAPIASIVVGGNSELVTGCSTPPCTITGTQNVTITYNTNTTITNTVTTTDGKFASVGVNFNFYHKRYLGFSAATVPTNTEILAALYQDNLGGTTALTDIIPQQGSAKYLFYVNTSSVTSVVINGFPSTSAFSLNNAITVTNASGASFSYLYTISNNQIGNLSTTTATFQ